MESKSILIQKAEFNPKIKTYFLLIGIIILMSTIVGIPLLFIWLMGLGQYISKNYYNNLSCQLSNTSLEFKKGILFKIEKTIPLENIQDLTFKENPLSKYLGLNILKIETAGQSNPQGSDMKLIGIINSYEFKQKVLSQRELLQSGNQVNNIPSGSDNNQVVNLLSEIKEILLTIKNK
tara:strand:- start:100 stop:633 length:534 start_codon:yes stop_codon:yes gene_type:complete